MSPDDGTAEGEFVGVFEVVAEAQAAGEGGDFHIELGNLPIDVEGGGFAFDVAAQGKDKFEGAGVIFRDPFHQFADCQVRGSYAVDWGNHAAKNVVETVILPRCLYAHHIAHRLDHADCAPVAGFVRADGADVRIRNHTALAAILHIVSQCGNRLSEMVDILLWLLQKIHRKTKGTPPTDARKSAYCFDCVFQQF